MRTGGIEQAESGTRRWELEAHGQRDPVVDDFVIPASHRHPDLSGQQKDGHGENQTRISRPNAINAMAIATALLQIRFMAAEAGCNATILRAR